MSKKLSNLHMRIETELKEAAAAAAATENRSLSNYIERLIIADIKERMEKGRE